jgi:geranylgeranyl pyrophosphate synthase
MLSINNIKKPIAADIDVFEEKFKASMQSSVPLLDRITHYIVKRKGKQIRPMFVFLLPAFAGASMSRPIAGLLWLSYCIRLPWYMTMWLITLISAVAFSLSTLYGKIK